MYDIEHDPIFQNYMSLKPNLTPDSKERYIKVLTKFCKSVNTPLYEIVENCKTEQNRIIEKTISCETDDDGAEIKIKEKIEFDVNKPDSQIKKYFKQYIHYCREKNNKNTTINNGVYVIRVILNYAGVKLPKWEKLDDDSDEWYLLEKEDFIYIINDSSPVHGSFIDFLKDTGMRVGDAVQQTIGDFMENTSKYHNYVDVEEFIDNAPDDMIGEWEFEPQKTQRFGVSCLTFNGPGSTKRILQNLRRIKNEYIPNKNKRDGLNLKISKDDALFGSKASYYKGPLKPKSIADEFALKNKKLRKWRIGKIKEAIKNGEISIEDYEKEVAKIPKFHAHACRKYFETMISRNCGDLRICTLLEGHVSPVPTDSSYIKIDVEQVKEAYMLALPDLSLDNTDTKVYTSDVRREMEVKIDNLIKENESLKEQYNQKEGQFNNMEERLSNVEKFFSDVDRLSDDDILRLFARKKED